MSLKFPYALMRLRKGRSESDIESMFESRDLPVVERKYDGHLVQIEKKGGKVRVFSRNAKPLNSRLQPVVDQLKKQIRKDGVYLGELISIDDGTHSLSGVQSIVSSAPKRARSIVEQGDVQIALFDKIANNGAVTASLPFADRREDLEASISPDGPAFVVDQYEWRDLQRAMRDSVAEGGEGVVLKDPQGAYKLNVKGEAEPRGSQWISAELRPELCRYLSWVRMRPDKPESSVTMKKNPLTSEQNEIAKTIMRRSGEREGDDIKDLIEALDASGYRTELLGELCAEDYIPAIEGIPRGIEFLLEITPPRPNKETRSRSRRRYDEEDGENTPLFAKVRYFRGKFSAEVFRKKTTPLVSQLIERKKIIPMLEDAIEYMSYLGADDDFVDRAYLALSENRVSDCIDLWAIWYSTFRLLPWILYDGQYTNYRYEVDGQKPCPSNATSSNAKGLLVENETINGPFIPTVGYVAEAKSVGRRRSAQEFENKNRAALDYAVNRWSEFRKKGGTLTIDLNSTSARPGDAQLVLDRVAIAARNEAEYARWISTVSKGVRVPRKELSLSSVGLMENLSGPLSPFGMYVGEGGINYFWKGVVDFGIPPGVEPEAEIDSEGPTIEELLEDEAQEAPVYDVAGTSEGASGLSFDFGEAGPSLSDLKGNPQSPYEPGYSPGFDYWIAKRPELKSEVSGLGNQQASGEYKIEGLRLNRWYATFESRKRVQAPKFPYVTALAFPHYGKYETEGEEPSIWETLGFAHEVFPLRATPGSGIYSGTRELFGQEFDYLEFFIDAVDFTRPDDFTRESSNPNDAAGDIRRSVAKVHSQKNPLIPRRGRKEMHQIISQSLEEISASVVDFDALKKEVKEENRFRNNVRSDLPGVRPKPGLACDPGRLYRQKSTGLIFMAMDNQEFLETKGKAAKKDCVFYRYEIGERPKLMQLSKKDAEDRFELIPNDMLFEHRPRRGGDVFIRTKDVMALMGELEGGMPVRQFLQKESLSGRMDRFMIVDHLIKRGDGIESYWYVWVEYPSTGDGVYMPAEYAMWQLAYDENGNPFGWNEDVLTPRITPRLEFDDSQEATLRNRWRSGIQGQDVEPGINPRRNPCIGIHLHSNDLEKIKEYIEIRQNPGFVDRMVRKHKSIVEKE